MMRLAFKVLFYILVFTAGFVQAQEREQCIEAREVSAYIRFLAADELQGRKTGDQSNWVAARYIAEQFRFFGVTSPSELEEEYYQVIPFANVTPPENGKLSVGDHVIAVEDNLLIRRAQPGMTEGELIYLPHAVPSQITNAVEGKFVLTNLGSEETTEPQASFTLTREKCKALQAKGALGIIEIYRGRHSWNLIKRYLGSGGLTILEEDEGVSDFTILTINDKMEEVIKTLKAGQRQSIKLDTDGTLIERRPSPNVIGMIEGTDPNLKDEFVVLSAHFDHVGTSVSSERPGTQIDSVFNGARDNAFGVAALLSAAEALTLAPPRRSVLLLACTAEEIGLLGSRYFVEHPVVPLDQIVFNLNTDGAGHSDSTIVAVMGLNRVGAASEIRQACTAFGLEPFADPAPEQNLFDRSDNVNFAAVGIPAPTFSPGFREFDKEIMRHYHQPSDEVDTLDFQYALSFCRAFALCARLIADKNERPRWSSGDKYEKAYKQLYFEK